MRTPSPSMIVATAALVASMSGGAYAASHLINGSQIKNGTITAKKLKKDTLTGAQINEKTLRQVPSAASAQNAVTAASAAHATNADTATHASTADAATTAKTADSATDATNATNATNATTADAALSAGHATDADKLGGTGPAGYVQGGGIAFSKGLTENKNTAVQDVFTVPNIGTIQMSCSAMGIPQVTMTNSLTHTSVDVSYSIITSAVIPTSGVVAPDGAQIVNLNGAPNVQAHVLVSWPDTAPTHTADFTIGLFENGTQGCVFQIAGSES